MLIFDASTLILIAKIELLDVFLTGASLQAAVSPTVEKECCSAKKTLDALIIRRALNESRIKVVTGENRRLVSKLAAEFSLGRGEAEAIAIGLAEKGSLVAIDDKNGINACKLLGVAFTTAIGILIRSREKNLLSRTEALASLASLARYGRYSEFIVEDARQRLERHA
jgi:predicted nucleic acid-binding protein